MCSVPPSRLSAPRTHSGADLPRSSALFSPALFSPVNFSPLFVALVACSLFGALPGWLHAAEQSERESDRRAEDDADQAGTSLQDVLPFLRANCLDCHDGADGEGGFDVRTMLRTAELTEASMHQWIRVHDRVRDGEMPPAEAGTLEDQQLQPFVSGVAKLIDREQSTRHARNGRVGTRRLTRDQLQWTLCDLLAIDVPLADLMPEEQRVDGFRGIAAAQSMSHYYLEDHLRVVDAALDFAFDRATGTADDSVIDLPPERIANKLEGQRNRDPELRQGAAVVWNGGVSFYGRISRSEVRVPGWYEITLRASALKPPPGKNIWCSIRSGKCVSREPLMGWVGAIEVTPEPQEFTFVTWLNRGEMLEVRPADRTLKQARFAGGQIGFGEGEPQDVPGIAMHHLTLRQVFPGGDRDAVRDHIFCDLKGHQVDDRPAAGNASKGSASKGKTSKQSVGRSFVLDSATDAPAMKKQVQRFASRAFRRPVDPEVMAPYLEMIDQGFEAGDGPVELLRQTYRAVLCSPRFVYFSEQPGALDDFAIASRLSYLLTGRGPDETLWRDAAEGRLTSDRQVIVSHVRRLLRGQHLDHFVRDFTDQWLDLADIDFTEPDRRMHPDFDLVVQNAMVQETRRFVTVLLADNQPAGRLIDADFTWLNSRLARFYGIEAEIEPSAWQRVSLADHPYRGGLLTQGSVLKVTANGTNTSPVVRGVWMCDRLLGVPIPDPPSNVPAIEPDVRGATTIREILEKHRSQTQCASCHAKIDPPGFALEHFDAAGQWRDHYLQRKGRSYQPGPEVNAAYELADGRQFESFVDFRNLAAEDDAAVARNFAAKVLTYGTGGEITFADRKALDQIVQQTAADQFRLRALVEAVVTSEPFLTK